jgi:pseudaminic acid cytidylyltransferase
MIIAVIPARGGSKRIPRKNIKLFAGKPMIAWSIEAAKKSEVFDDIIVSTDDEEIANIALKYGASVPFLRPANLSDDFVGTNAVVKHAITFLNDSGKNVEYACCIYATAPFIRPYYIKHGFNKMIDKKTKFAFSVTTFPFPVQRALRIKKNSIVEPIWPEFILDRSQDLEEAFHDAGQFYWGRAEAFIDEDDMYAKNSYPIKLPRYLTQDIDTDEDWAQAELMFNALLNDKNRVIDEC